MTEVEKKSGIYESNDGNDMIVDGKKYPITIPVANWIRDKKYQSGLNVTFEIKEQNGRMVVTKVYPTPSGKPATEPTKEELDRSREEYNATAAKMAKAGFGRATPGPATPAAQATAAAKKPADDGLPKALEGKIVSYSPAPARSFTLQSEEGFKVVISWRENQDTAMAAFKPGYKAKATYEVGEPNRLTEIVSTFKKGPGAGKGSYQPRNERLIVLQSCAKLAAEVYAITTTPDTQDFDHAMDTIIARAIKDADTLMKNGGA
jgi:hypothetical protein